MIDSASAFALAGLLHAPLQQWPDLRPLLPSWWQDVETAANRGSAVAWATRLAAGQPDNKQLQPNGLLSNHVPRRSIFSSLNRPESADLPEARFLPICELAVEAAAIFPVAKPTAEDAQQAYNDLLKTLHATLADLQSLTDQTSYIHGVYDALRQTTWCLPNPYSSKAAEADTSLFDHCRLVAALAPCYAADPQAQGVIFVYGDISGVQDFIYTITAKGATSGLRGRSLYLQLLCEAVARFLLHRLKLPPTSLLYASGGHFLLAAPLDAAEALADARRDIALQLLDYHQGELYLSVGQAVFNSADFHPEYFTIAYGRLREAVEQNKRQRFRELSETELLQRLFTPQGHGGDQTTDCQVCHYEGDDVADHDLDRPPDEAPTLKCALCASLEELGKALRNATHLLLVEAETTTDGERDWTTILTNFGLYPVVINAEASNPLPPLPSTGHRGRLLSLPPKPGKETAAQRRQQDKKVLAALQRMAAYPVVLTHSLLVNVTPTVSQRDIEDYEQRHPQQDLKKEGVIFRQVKPFNLLEDQAQGIKRLGVLRMDVDDLGLLFSEGFAKGQRGLLRTIALSFAFSLYFEGWVEHLAEEASEGRNVVYSIYSGGDDLFIVGAWDVLPDLAYDIARHLQRYALGNPTVHASAGITLHGGKFPLYQAAEMAAAALEQAKSYTSAGNDKPTKNAFTFLGRTRPWADYEGVREEFNRLRLLIEKKAPRALLHSLLRLNAQYEQHKREEREAGRLEKVYWGPWHWRSAYQLTRTARQNKTHEQAIHAIRDSLSGESFSHIEQLGFSARWAELYLRGKQGGSNGQSDTVHD